MVVAAKPEVRLPSGGVRNQWSQRIVPVLVAAIVIVAACRKWDNPLDPVGNHRPIVPSSPRPADSAIETSTGLVLSWHSLDQDDGDTAYFDVFLGAASPPDLVQAAWTDTIFEPTGLACSTHYYWQVIAYDNHGDSAEGPVWQFTTAAAISVTAPDTGEQLTMYSQDTVTWAGGPPDAGDSTVLSVSVNNGASWIRLGRAVEPGRFVWVVPAPATESARVKVKVFAMSDTMTGKSGRFAILDTITGTRVGKRYHGSASGEAARSAAANGGIFVPTFLLFQNCREKAGEVTVIRR